jgi:adenosylhomocysteine nucleosidase
MVKEFLSQRGVPYTLKNLARDPEARGEFLRAGYLLPPVTVIGGKAVPGYRPDEIERLLAEDGESGGAPRPDD